MYICNICSYKTNRKSNYTYHINRKNPCKSTLSDSSHLSNNPNVANSCPNVANLCPDVANSCPDVANLCPDVANSDQNICQKCSKYFVTKSGLHKHSKTCKGISSLQCPICFKVFDDRKLKYKHVKKGKCSPPENIEKDATKDVISIKEENARLKKENELLKSNKPIIIQNNTTNNNIQINSYTNPYIDHMTKNVIRRLYYDSKQEEKMLILGAIIKIFRNEKFPQNDCIRFGMKSKYAEVQIGDKLVTLPLTEVLETVLTKSSEVCGEGLRECEEDGSIYGTRCSVVKELMYTLATDDKDGDKENRAKYLPYVKAALLSGTLNPK